MDNKAFQYVQFLVESRLQVHHIMCTSVSSQDPIDCNSPEDEKSVYESSPQLASTYKRLLGFDVEGDVDGFGDEILQEIARTGMLCYPWQLIKPIVAHKLEQMVGKYDPKKLCHSDPVTMKQLSKEQLERCLNDQLELYDKLLAFENPPWTMQRLCELLLQIPGTQHRTRESILFALRRLINVKSTLGIITPQQYVRNTLANANSIKQFQELGQGLTFQKPLPPYPRVFSVPRIYQKPLYDIVVSVLLYIITFFTAILLWNSI